VFAHEGRHPTWVLPAVLAQAPADGFIDEKFPRAQIVQDNFF